jgi:DNA segregation ATPase FtsK/SpoIIIE, S-DNA-T family
VITRYYVQLPRGLRSNVVANLDQDIARGLAVASCRVVEQVEGRTEVALELPNEQRETVFFSEIVESNAFRQAQSSVTLVLGKNVSGDPVVGDLSQQMPHVLVAGTTGSGKSMSLQAMILGLMLKSAPNDLRLILIDPKQLEFAHFNGVGHMLMPVITDMHEATNALSWCVSEMERRYSIMRDSGVRDLKGFNQTTEEVLPRIVVVIDEFADLIMANKDVEQLIVRLAQKARACGIHLIVATQRPCSNVITGLIKANISARIALKTASKNDSRIILDQSGAEQLLGQGDMLISQGNQLQRIHGAYVSDDELNQSLAAIRQKYPEPQYLELIDTEKMELNNMDVLFNEALKLVKEKGRASIRLLQRHFKIGYTRASRLIDEMEQQEFISPPDSENQRVLLV